jgi:hypothetical protein
MDVRSLIRDLGGPTKVAVLVNLQASAISNWSARDSVPAEYHLAVWRLAIEAGIPWQPPGTDGLMLVAEAA